MVADSYGGLGAECADSVVAAGVDQSNGYELACLVDGQLDVAVVADYDGGLDGLLAGLSP